MKVQIERVANGYLIKSTDEVMEVFEESVEHELESLRKLLYSVLDRLGYYGSKHDAERLFIEIKKQRP